MKKALIVISILIGIFVIGSLNSQKVFSVCGNGCGCYSGSCPSDRPNDVGNPGGQCQISGQKVCCSDSCPGEGPTDTPSCDEHKWGGCSTSCGPGSQTNACGDTRGCNNGACCDPNNWGGWGACSAACGGGTQSRTNACGTVQSQACNTQACVVPTNTPAPTSTVPSPTINPACTCDTGDVCSATNCTFQKFTDVTYASPLKCSLSSSLFPSPPTDKNSWCQRGLRTKGDADGNGIINATDYFYYVAVVNGGKIPVTANPDFNGDGEVGTTDRTIIVKSLP